MPISATTLDKDTLDAVIYRTIGVVNASLLAEAHDLNPTISNYGATLPFGIEVEVPDRPSDAQRVETTIKLYD